MSKIHNYSTHITWTGNKGEGTTNYTAYERNYQVHSKGKEIIEASSDTAFRGDATKYNPEDLLLSSLSACHMLWYLHLCADNGIIVTSYEDRPIGIMEQDVTGAGKFTEVVLHPIVKVKDNSMIEKAMTLHKNANKFCFIANSMNFEIKHNAKVESLN